ncbi:hypothetical protein PT974_05099 [Cladobotryum mycophilum]|uniref:Uncharacterized protein n=1 Tax=Cladobotryum mycophilum TaxID=491253 RepID=A0ABR0SR12_9HYPO
MDDSWWDDFSNNLATDLAPLVSLFGEFPTKQYLSECLTTEDIVIFAVAPLGVITAIVSAIRVCGTPSLRAFIGRAQEGAGTAEAELCSSTSRDVCELYNNGGIARVFGRPKLLEIVHDPEPSLDAFYPQPDGFSPLLKAKQQLVYTHSQNDYAVPLTVIGTVFLSVGMALCAHLVESKSKKRVYKRTSPKDQTPQARMYWIQPGNQTIGDQMFDPFAYSDAKSPLQKYITSWKATGGDHTNMGWTWTAVATTVIGFICQFLGLRACHSSVAIAQFGITLIMSGIRSGLRTQRLSRDDNFMVHDPDFFQGNELDFLALKLGQSQPSTAKTSPLMEIQSRRVWRIFSAPRAVDVTTSHNSDRNIPPRTDTLSSLDSRVNQSSSVLEKLPVLESGSCILSGFRVKLPYPISLFDSTDPLEAATSRELFKWLSTEYCSACKNKSNCVSGDCKRDPRSAVKTFFYRSRLARMTGIEGPESEKSNHWGERLVPVRGAALVLAQAIEDTMQILFTYNSQPPIRLYEPWGDACAIFWTVQGSLLDPLMQMHQSSHIHMSLRRATDQDGSPEGAWKADRSEIEAVLGLWFWSLKEQNTGQDMGDMERKEAKERISRIISNHTSPLYESGEMQDLNIWHRRGGVKIRQRHLKASPCMDRGHAPNIIETGDSSYRAFNYAPVQNAVWGRIKSHKEYVAGLAGPPTPFSDHRRFFGWHNIETNSPEGELVVFDVVSKSSLLLNCAQEIYSLFFRAITQAVEGIGGRTEATRYHGGLTLANENVSCIQRALIARGLCDADDAFACTIPILKSQNKLPIPADASSTVAELANESRRKKR